MFKTFTFKRGTHPHEVGGGKHVTGKKPIENAAPPDTVAIPLLQHIGAVCQPLVKAGDHVNMGQKIGEPMGYVGAAVHASVSGKVIGIKTRTVGNGQRLNCVIIENDGLDTPDPNIKGVEDPDNASPETLLAAIREAGVVGLGGAAFPTHVKLSPPKEMRIDYIIVNGAECEPYLTSDHRMMVEDAKSIVDGLLIARRIVGADHMRIGIEVNKPDAIHAITEAAKGTPIVVCPLKVKYPQGGEKQLINAITGRQVPSGKLPMDAGCVVLNASTAAAVSHAVREGAPLISRIVTVTGAVENPRNLRVRIGSDIKTIITQCGGPKPGVNKIVLGGPMMGQSAYSSHTPVIKGTSGILLIADNSPAEIPVGNCIRCATCAHACPIGLMPMLMYAVATKERFEEMRDRFHLKDCIECGSCSYVCPAKLPLVHMFRVAKRALPRKNV